MLYLLLNTKLYLNYGFYPCNALSVLKFQVKI